MEKLSPLCRTNRPNRHHMDPKILEFKKRAIKFSVLLDPFLTLRLPWDSRTISLTLDQRVQWTPPSHLGIMHIIFQNSFFMHP